MEQENQEEVEQVTHPTVELIKAKWQKIYGLTKNGDEDKLWMLAVKLFFKGILFLLLIMLSPIAFLAIMISLLVAG